MNQKVIILSLETMMKILVFTNISIVRFYGYIMIYREILTEASTKNISE